MSDILNTILQRKTAEVRARSLIVSRQEIVQQAAAQPPPRDFVQALRAKQSQNLPAVIAEIKKASPSKGLLRAAFDPPSIARTYEKHGAACLSVLTDTDFFQGSTAALQAARAACELPVIRKDFLIDAYQVYESRAMGADCILLIVAALDDERLQELAELAQQLQMAVLVEVHDAAELARALHLSTPLIGINNRDLRTFHVDLNTTLNLLPHIPAERLVIAESGITTPVDVTRLRGGGVHSFLVGEIFMRAPDPGIALAELFGT